MTNSRAKIPKEKIQQIRELRARYKDARMHKTMEEFKILITQIEKEMKEKEIPEDYLHIPDAAFERFVERASEEILSNN
jgi:hypothetical protein